LPTDLRYSQRNVASGNWNARSFGAQRSNLLAATNRESMPGLRSRTLSGHPGVAVRILMLSDRLRNFQPRLRREAAFFSPDLRFSHSSKTPTITPVRKASANLNQGC
jgi:hypothetical protein